MTGPWWRMSPRDSLSHAFPADQDDVVDWKALCGHVTPASSLVDDPEGMKCFACLLAHGNALADQTGVNPWTP